MLSVAGLTRTILRSIHLLWPNGRFHCCSQACCVHSTAQCYSMERRSNSARTDYNVGHSIYNSIERVNSLSTANLCTGQRMTQPVIFEEADYGRMKLLQEMKTIFRVIFSRERLKIQIRSRLNLLWHRVHSYGSLIKVYQTEVYWSPWAGASLCSPVKH